MRTIFRITLATVAVLSLATVAAGSAQAAPATPSAPVSSAIYVTHAAPASHHHAVRPHNWWNGLPQYFFNEYFGDQTCARIDGAGALILGSGDCTPFHAVICSTCLNSYILVEGTSPGISGPCLYYDATGARDGVGNSFDLSGCSADVSDIWFSSSTNLWSQWINGGAPVHNGLQDSMWAHTCTGTGCPMYANNQDGTNKRDHWQAIDVI